MQIALRLVEHGEVGLRRKIVEEIEQCQSGNIYAVFEHIDVMLLVEGELFVNSLYELYDIAVIIPHASSSFHYRTTLPDTERSPRRICRRS